MKEVRKGMLLVISGPSGAGKGRDTLHSVSGREQEHHLGSFRCRLVIRAQTLCVVGT